MLLGRPMAVLLLGCRVDMHVSGWSLISDCCVTRMVQWFVSQQEKLCAVGKRLMTRFYTRLWSMVTHIYYDPWYTKGKGNGQWGGGNAIHRQLIYRQRLWYRRGSTKKIKESDTITWIMCVCVVYASCWQQMPGGAAVVAVAPFINSCPPSATESERKTSSDAYLVLSFLICIRVMSWFQKQVRLSPRPRGKLLSIHTYSSASNSWCFIQAAILSMTRLWVKYQRSGSSK